MKNAFNIIGLVLALLLVFSSCQKAPFLTFTGQKSFTFKDAGGSETITFSCNRAWTVSSSESWLTVSPAKGDANEEGARVTITCAANTTYDSRNATITISSDGLTETISVSQDTNYGLLSDPTTFNLTNVAQNIEVDVKANVEYTTAIDDACKDWISQVGTKALSSTKLTFSIAANESYDDREGKITISQKGSASSVQPQVITVKQSQTNGLFITTPKYELSNESHDLTIEVKANIDYEVTSEADWIKYEASSTKALSATTFTLKVDKNETYDQRVGKVKVNGGGLEEIITITQTENLGLFVSPGSVEISDKAQEIEVDIQYNVDFDVLIPEDAKGAMITAVKYDGEGGTKTLSTRKYRISISENNKYDNRETSVTFKQKNGPLCGTVNLFQYRTDINLSEKETANCYIASSSGGYYFDANKRGNTSKTIGMPVTATVLWETFGTAEKPNVGDLISSVKLIDEQVYFVIPRNYKQGNALIAIEDSNSEILWSWHIWVTNADIEGLSQEYVNGAGVLMDRNLGAVSIIPGDYLATGLLYQWGRKDPFINGCKYDSNEYAASTADWPTGYTYADHTNGNIEYATKNPMTWLHCNGYNEDWLYTGDKSRDNTRWNKEKGEYDPCPPGWKVPDGNFWTTAFGRSDYSFDGYKMWDGENYGFHLNVLSDKSNDAWYPMSNAKNLYEGTIGVYGYKSGNWWTSEYGVRLSLWNGGEVRPHDTWERTWGLSVRCQKVDK